MKERGKAVEVYNNNIDFFQDYTSSDVVPCRKHPQCSATGICAYCLKDRLINLVCSDCGEQRLSSCSCSEIATNPRNSCAGGEVGSVGRVSFLTENENKDQAVQNPKAKSSSSSRNNNTKPDDVYLLKRSNSSCVEIKKKNGFWRIGRFFKKKRGKETNCGKSVCGVDEKSDLWVVDCMGVSRSRSLRSFRGGGFFGSEDGSDLMNCSGARSSISAARSSGVNGGLVYDPERKSGFSEAEPRRSGFDSERRDSTFIESDIADIRAIRKSGAGLGVGGGLMDVDGGFSGANRRVFSLKENYFNGGDDWGFIDLKFDFQAESKGDIPPSMKKSVLSGFGSMREAGEFMPYKSSGSIENALPIPGNGALSNGSSYQMAMDESGIRKKNRYFKGWRWIFKAPSRLDQSREEK
ncbi:hypothetical protein F3Y22_tig00112383pilonHSYRG00308 [Hibiscus syriacus]|uniref:Uncharacterized protein n=1 Tax=Hibiscus syriacus TaxID=106335 RepID=A0A6A2WZM6_HIBSY|nr:uncharacterized protein LOC120178814 [Hibiscus syriacus]KAE8667682.1 hypothetical protein F3Y22_tig00112383pilonHSYRG00308 [Hibiscus syriacus]